MKLIKTTKAPKAIGPYSQAVSTGCEKFVFTSGQLGLDPATGDFAGSDVAAQARQALHNIQAVLQESGANINGIIKTTVYLVEMDKFSAVNQEYTHFFKEHKPARSVVGVKQLPKGAVVEIEAIACVNQ